jgi:hypothetical protein
LQVGESDGAERLGECGSEVLDIGAVSALGVRGALVKPQMDERIVGGSSGEVRRDVERGKNGDLGVHGGQGSTKAG